MEFKHLIKRLRGAGILALALLFTSGVAFGQAQTGNLFVRVADEQGGTLPGVAVTLSGIGAAITQVTDVAGEARFLSLSPGSYVLDFALSGFTRVTRKNVSIAVGQNTELTTTMKLSSVQEQVVVTAESPLLDTKKTGSQTTVTGVELASVPTARDPWVVLQTAPGVQVDRVNVGGSESGQQSVYVGKGSMTTQGTWNVDGVNITDMGALGSSPAYYDFDAFAEMNIATGGADAAIGTPGVQLNMVTKRGTNDVHGSARVFYESKKTSSTNVTNDLLTQQQNLGLTTASGNTVNQLQDYGAELGGPVVPDILWLWGSYGRNQIDLITAGGVSDKTTLLNYSFKLNLQAVPENNFTASYLNNDKQKFGRNASPSRTQATTDDQSGPTKIYKLEDSEIFNSSVFATVTFSRVMGGFQFLPEGGNAQTYEDSNSIYHNSFYYYNTQRPQTQLSVTPSFFLRTGNIGHELKAGFGYRKTPIASSTSWPQGIIALDANANFDGLPVPVAAFTRDGVANVDMKSYFGFLSDTLTVDKLTVNIGLRYDRGVGQNIPFNDPVGQYDPNIWSQVPLRTLSVPGTPALTQAAFEPRIGASYSIDDKTVARISYARFVNQMGVANVNYNSPAPGDTYLYYAWNDKNGNHKVDPGEVDFSQGLLGYFNWDPNNPNSVTSSINQVNYNMTPPHTDEFILGVEHELVPAFVVGVTGTYRRMSDLIFLDRLSADGSRVLNPSDFTCTQSGPYVVPGEGPESVTVCNPKPGVAGPGNIETNRPGYYQTYWGIDFSATKRYSDRWMARFNFTYSDWTQHGLAEGMVDPSNLVGGTAVEGGFVAPVSAGSGSKGFVYINSKWQGALSAMYTLPLDFNVSSSMFARQGYADPYYVTIASHNLPGVTSKNYQLGTADDIRNPAVFEWDMGLAKAVRAGGLTATLQADCFNILNRGTVLQRQLRVRSTTTTPYAADNYVYEIQSPRIWRLGVRLGF